MSVILVAPNELNGSLPCSPQWQLWVETDHLAICNVTKEIDE
jgi:hypothetical protein